MNGMKVGGSLGLIVIALGSTAVLADLLPADGPRAYDHTFLRDAGFIEAGPLRWYPSLQTGIGYDSNIFESAEHVRSSKMTRLVPELSALLQRDTLALQFGYRADHLQYAASSDDNFTDQTLFARSHLEAGYRHRLDLDAAADKSHEARGSGITIGVDPDSSAMPDTPDAFLDKHANVNYAYGAPTAAGQLRLALSALDHTYENHRDRTRFFDRSETQIGSTFLWRVLPRTSLAFEARSKRVDYPSEQVGQPSLDSRERDLLFGAEWKASEKTSGSLRLGNKAKDFKANARNDNSNLAWEASALWSPRSYSHFTLRLDRSPQETTGAGDFVDARTTSLDWKHQWRQRLDTRLQLSALNERYQNGDRNQQTRAAKFDVGYAMSHWLTWRVAAEWRDRSSDLSAFEFSRNRYWLSVEFRL